MILILFRRHLMKSKLLSILALVSVAILLTGCVKKTDTTTSNGTTPTGSEEETIKSTLLDLVKSGKSLKCTFSTGDSNGTYSGVTYVSGIKSSSNFKITAPDGSITESNTIMNGEWMYIWSPGVAQGTKMKISDFQTQDNTQANSQTNVAKNSIDYKCSAWIADNSKFNPPSEIQFVDLSETLKKTQNDMKQYCSMCDQSVDATAIAECKKNLGCE
jgi:outer membrane lipoprotein-sorting protein